MLYFLVTFQCLHLFTESVLNPWVCVGICQNPWTQHQHKPIRIQCPTQRLDTHGAIYHSVKLIGLLLTCIVSPQDWWQKSEMRENCAPHLWGLKLYLKLSWKQSASWCTRLQYCTHIKLFTVMKGIIRNQPEYLCLSPTFRELFLIVIL